MNFMTGQIIEQFKFINPLNKQPQFFELNFDQTICLVSTQKECLWINRKTKIEKDMDEELKVKEIKEIKYDSELNSFFMLSNKYQQLLGFYVQKIDADRPEKNNFLIKWKNKLDIGDTNIFILRNKEHGYREICISYKTIYINTYNIMVMDMKSDT